FFVFERFVGCRPRFLYFWRRRLYVLFVVILLVPVFIFGQNVFGLTTLTGNRFGCRWLLLRCLERNELLHLRIFVGIFPVRYSISSSSRNHLIEVFRSRSRLCFIRCLRVRSDLYFCLSPLLWRRSARE